MDLRVSRPARAARPDVLCVTVPCVWQLTVRCESLCSAAVSPKRRSAWKGAALLFFWAWQHTHVTRDKVHARAELTFAGASSRRLSDTAMQ
eukprot:scaffold28105_cov139-Isochrysis_galbana.AAC.7